MNLEALLHASINGANKHLDRASLGNISADHMRAHAQVAATYVQLGGLLNNLIQTRGPTI